MKFLKVLYFAMILILIQPAGVRAEISDYRTMPDFVKQIMNVPSAPRALPSPDGKELLLVQHGNLFSVEELARPTVGLAGILIDPKSNSRRPLDLSERLEVYTIKDGEKRAVENIPEGSRIGHVSWSPKGKLIAMALYGESGLELWVADLKSMQAKRLSDLNLNDVLGTPYKWSLDGRSIIALTVPQERGPRPELSKHKFGPKVRDSDGQAKPARTYQNLLQSGYDIMLFEYLARSEIFRIKLDGKYTQTAPLNLYRKISPSPDGRFILTETVHPPYSYYFPVDRFPVRVDIIDMEGKIIHKVDDLPLAFKIPHGRLSVRTGARHSAWNPETAAELWWVKALDQGNPENEAHFRDEIFSIKAPFDEQPVSRLKIPARFRNMFWGTETFALVTGKDTISGTRLSWMINPEQKDYIPQALLPGENEFGKGKLTALTKTVAGPFKQCLLSPDRDSIYLSGYDTSPFPGREVLLSLNMETRTEKLEWVGKVDALEKVILPVDEDDGLWIVHSQSFTEPPNYYLRNGYNSQIRALTNFTHPVPALENIQKQRLEYRRQDGVKLAGDLYLPPGYKTEDGPLPVLIWIYPREYRNTETAEKAIKDSKGFIALGRKSRMFWPLLGYALLDNPTMPIIGTKETKPNDTYLDQMHMNAEATVSELVRIGVASPGNIAVGGHSYGAFATANLLAHTDFFAAGIARSGAYNRSLTPFGFQREYRTFWTEPELYGKLSPFFHISKMESPILLIHGEHDQNAGTYPEQSERYYQALVGLGKKARLVMLPHEGHSYYGRESIMHMIWEMQRWLDLHLKKNSAPTETEQQEAAPQTTDNQEKNPEEIQGSVAPDQGQVSPNK